MFCNPFRYRKDNANALTSANGDDAEVNLDPKGDAPDPFNLGPLALRRPVPASNNPTSEQLSLLRRELNKAKLDWYIVPSDDAHASETPAPPDQRRGYISGFTGSAGTALVAQHSAHLFTDGRYWVQAGQQLDENWTLHKVGSPGVDNWFKYLLSVLNPSDRVGFDPTTLGYAVAQDLIAQIQASGARVSTPTKNLIDTIWSTRPLPRKVPIYEHPLQYSGDKAEHKLVRLSKWSLEYVEAQRKARQDPLWGTDGSTYFVTALDEVAWLLNLRGDSIPFTPVFPAYVTLTNVTQPGQITPTLIVTLYVDWDLVPPHSPTLSYLTKIGVHVARYEDIWTVLGEPYAKDHVLLAAPSSSWRVATSWRGSRSNLVVFSLSDNWIAQTKAIKNETELAGMRAAYLRDGAAWVQWISHLEADLHAGKQVDEWAAAQRLIEVRSRNSMYRGESYGPISATAGNAALPHYQTGPEQTQVIDPRTPYLCDAGGQYPDGTIDTTRTVFFSVGGTSPTEEHKRAFTRVLQGHIAVDSARWPQGTSAAQLDVLARQHLFHDGYNYAHGTGHGVGSFLGVHEGPQGFSSSTPLVEGHVISNEPGYYEEGQFGIRIESVLEVVEVQTHRQFGQVQWFGFNRLTVVPIDYQLVDETLLSPTEHNWLLQHNETAKAKLLPLIRHDPVAVRWLHRQ